MNPQDPPVKNFMTKEVVTVRQGMPLLTAVDSLLKNKVNGLPVVDEDGVLVGVLTEDDLMIRGSRVHLPTFVKLFTEFDIYSKDQEFLGNQAKKILMMKVSDAMNQQPLIIHPDDGISDAVRTFSQYHAVNLIPVVGDFNRVVGALTRYDLAKFIGTASVDLVSNSEEREIDKNVNKFLRDFEKQFFFVSRFRTRYWLVASLISVAVGFVLAFALMLRFISR